MDMPKFKTMEGEEIERLRAEVEALRDDKARLDWLENADRGGYYCEIMNHMETTGDWEQPDNTLSYPSLRQAIDAARKEAE